MGTILFNAFVIPKEIKEGKLQISVCFELEIDHDVFNDNQQNESDIEAWKDTIKQFPDMARFMHEDGQLLLNGNIALKPINKVTNITEVRHFWGSFLGYQIDEKGIHLRPKKKKPAYAAIDNTKKSIVSLLPKPLQMKISAQPMIGQFNTAAQSYYKSKTNADYPQSVAMILESIKAHEMLVTSKQLDKEIVEGIDTAYYADVNGNKQRFDSLNEYANYFEHKKTVNFAPEILNELNTLDREKVNRLSSFQSVAATVINEPRYIKEAIHKLGGILSVRRFVGTIIEFEAAALPAGQLKIGLSTVNLNDPLYKLITKSISFDFKTKITTDPLLQAIVPEPVNDGKYTQFYASALAKLRSKAKIINYEPESIQRNFSQASENVRQDLEYENLTFDAYDLQESKKAIDPGFASGQKLAIQTSRIKLEQLNKIGIKLVNRIANLQTKGHQMIVTDTNWLSYDPNGTGAATYDVHEHDILNGYVTYQRIKENGQVVCDWKSLNQISEYFGEATTLKKDFKNTDLAVDVDTFVDSLTSDAGGTPLLNGINNGFLFLFDGTTVSSRNPLRHYEREYEDGQVQRMETLMNFAEMVNTAPPEATALFLEGKKILAEDYFPFRKNPKSKYVIARQFIFRTATGKITPGLKFSNTRTYEYIMAMQYLNGFSPVNEQWLKQAGSALDAFISDEAKFLRHDHIKEVIVSFEENIFHHGTKKIKAQFIGETVKDLVIRKGNLLSNDQCVRYLLPPPIPTFQTYLWYDFENKDSFCQNRNLSSEQLFPYYNKYQCEMKSADEFNKEKLKNRSCRQNCSQYCGGTEQPPVYNGKLNYLPDPVVNGYLVKFYYDRECHQIAHTELYPEQFCPIKKGIYPQLGAWRIKLVRIKPKNTYIHVDEDLQEIKIYVPDGKQVYAEFWPTYHTRFGCFEDDLLSIKTIQKKIENNITFDPLHSCAVVMSFTSALQRPLFSPEIQDISFTKYNKGVANRKVTSVTANVSLKFEHLNHWGAVQVQGTQPTGELELYGLWDDYSTNTKGPQMSIENKKKKTITGGFIYLGKLVFKNPEDPLAYQPTKTNAIAGSIDEIASSEMQAEVIFEFESSFPIPYFTPSIFKVRNTSKFISYFENLNAAEIDQNEKEMFCRWSKITKNPAVSFSDFNYSNGVGIAKASYLFNNQKPQVPVIEKIIPLIVRDTQETTNKVSVYERFRICYHADLLGKGGRLGIIIKDGQSVYATQLQSYRSHAGIDSVMDNFADRLDLEGNLLGRDNFNIMTNLEKEYIDNFNPQFDDTDPAQKIGLVSYIPNYDPVQRLWYVDIELNLKNKKNLELHSPFVQLGLVSYQPRSANYAYQNGSIDDTHDAYQNDFRVSDPIKADFFSIRPSRNFNNPFVLFKHRSTDKFSLSGAVSSLYFKDSANKKQLKSEFLLCVQEEGHSDFWNVVPSKLFKKRFCLNGVLHGDEIREVELRYHPLLTELEALPLSYTDQIFEVEFGIWFQKKLFGKHRIIIYEIECHNNLDLADLPMLLSQGELSHINGVNIINNFIFSREDSL